MNTSLDWIPDSHVFIATQKIATPTFHSPHLQFFSRERETVLALLLQPLLLCTIWNLTSLLARMVGVDQSKVGEYFSVKWFSDWEGYGCVALRDVDEHTLIHTEEPFLRGPQLNQALDNHIKERNLP